MVLIFKAGETDSSGLGLAGKPRSERAALCSHFAFWSRNLCWPFSVLGFRSAQGPLARTGAGGPSPLTCESSRVWMEPVGFSRTPLGSMLKDFTDFKLGLKMCNLSCFVLFLGGDPVLGLGPGVFYLLNP